MNDCWIGLRQRVFTGTAAALICAMALPGQAYALALGDIEVQSRLNQPMRATIPVIAGTRDELESLKVGLASPDAFERAGVPLTSVVRQLEFTIVPASGGRTANVLVVGQAGAREPFIDLLVEANWRSGNLVRNYTILLDPPQTIQQAANAAATRPVPPTVVIAPVPVRPAPAPAAEPALVDDLPIAKTYPLEDTATASSGTEFSNNDSVSSSDPEYFESGAGWVDGQGQPTRSSSTSSVGADDRSGRRYGPVAPKETLWSIAYSLRTDAGITMDQMQLGLYRANPSAFVGGNINRMLKGSILAVPSNTVFKSIDPAVAKREVANQRASYSGPTSLRSSQRVTTPSAAQPKPAVQSEPQAIESTDSAGPANASGSALDRMNAPAPAASGVSNPTPTASQSAAVPAEPTPREPSALERLAAGYQGADRASASEDAPTPVAIAKPADSGQTSPRVRNPQDLLAEMEAKRNAPKTESSVTNTGTAAQPSTQADRASGGSVLDNMDAPDTVAPQASDDDPAQQAAPSNVSALDRLRAARNDADSTGQTPRTATATAQDTDTSAPIKVAVVAPAASETSDEGGGLPWLLIALIAAALLAMVGLFAWRRKRTAHSPDGGVAMASPVPAPKPLLPPVTEADDQAVDAFADTTVEHADETPGAASTGRAAPTGSDVDEHGFDSTMIMKADTPAPEAADVTPASAADIDLSTDTISLDLSGDDPLAEADVHLAFGAYAEAIDTLKGAAAVHPERADIKTKLAEVYFVSEDKDAFVEHAQSVKAQLEAGAPGEWQKIAIMGQQIAADSPLFEGDEPLAVADTDFDLGDADQVDADSSDLAQETGTIDPKPSNDDALEFDLGDFDFGESDDPTDDEPDALDLSMTDDVADNDGLLAGLDEELNADLDLGDGDLAIEAASDDDETADAALADADDDQDDLGDLPGLSDDPLQDLSLDDAALDVGGDDASDEDDIDALLDLGDFDLGDADDSAENPLADLEASPEQDEGDTSSAEEPSSETADSDAIDLDSFDDFGDFELSDDATSDTPDAAQDVLIDDDSELDFGLDAEEPASSASDGLNADGDEMETKLDLARAYAEMGDADLARGLLEEVIESGAEHQVDEAKSLLEML